MIPVFPTTYFGSIDYFRAIAQYREVLIEAKEHYPKQTYRNRCEILGANGILALSIPTERPQGSKTPTDKIILPSTENWRARHWRSIHSAYSSAPYFEYYGMEVEELIMQDEFELLPYNMRITERILSWLDLDTRISLTDEFQPIIPNDPRLHLAQKDTLDITTRAPYIQVFPSDDSYRSTLSILDAIMCIGPLARNLLIERP
jgi:hypothetical protein